VIQQISNIPWQHNNAHRGYPFHDKATLIDTDGNELPDDVIVDCHLWFPGTVGEKVMVSSVGISTHLTSVTFSVAGNSFRPLAGITVVGKVTPGRNYHLSPLVDGVGGWVTFGPGANKEVMHFRFPYAVGDAVQRSELLTRSARAYDVSGFVTSLRKFGRADGMTGVVSFVSSTPEQLIIERGLRTIEGVGEVEAVIFRLNASVSVDVYSRFLSECDKTPDSNLCLKPHISAINEVTPDCNGAITINFEEVEDPLTGPIISIDMETDEDSTGHVKINSAIGMAEVCARGIPDLNNQLSRCESCEEFIWPGPFEGYVPRFESTP